LRNPLKTQVITNERTHRWLEEEEHKIKSSLSRTRSHELMSYGNAYLDMQLLKIKSFRAALNLVTYFCLEFGVDVTVTKEEGNGREGQTD